MRRTVIATSALALLLSGCASAGSTDGNDVGAGSVNAESSPTEVVKQYVAALNEGDIAAALALVADPQEVRVDSVLTLDAIDIPEPRAEVSAVTDEQDVATLSYDVGGTSHDVPFIRSEDGWRLRRPEFLVPTFQGSNTLAGALHLAHSTFTTESGDDLMSASHVVMTGDHDVPVDISFPGNEYVAPMAHMSGTAKFREGGPAPLTFSITDPSREEWSLTDSFYATMRGQFMEGQEFSVPRATLTAVDFPAKEKCSVGLANTVEIVAGDNLEPQCLGGTVRTTVTEAYTGWIGRAEGPAVDHEVGDTTESPGAFMVTINDGQMEASLVGDW